MQEPSPSLEERIRAGTGMASSNTQNAKNAKEQHHPDAMELSQSTKGRHETMLQQEKIRSNGKLGNSHPMKAGIFFQAFS